MCQANATPPGVGDACLTVRQESLEATLCDLTISPDGAVQAREAHARWERRLASLRLPFALTLPRFAAAEKRPVRTAPRGPADERESVDLNELLTEARRTLGDLVGDRIELSVVPAAERAGVAAAGRRLWTLLRALVGAACRRMPHGGTLTVETADTVLDAEFCSSHGRLRPGAYVMLALSDAGLPGPRGIGSAGGGSRPTVASRAPHAPGGGEWPTRLLGRSAAASVGTRASDGATQRRSSCRAPASRTDRGAQGSPPTVCREASRPCSSSTEIVRSGHKPFAGLRALDTRSWLRAIRLRRARSATVSKDRSTC